ncbi:hypothetical protein [Pontiella sp.]|uniref:hypothetical protein n=1 Tax=Pontiella sp. TaxID=2837462 RepID=UPI003566B937
MNERTARAEKASVPLGVNGLRFAVSDGSAEACGMVFSERSKSHTFYRTRAPAASLFLGGPQKYGRRKPVESARGLG